MKNESINAFNLQKFWTLTLSSLFQTLSFVLFWFGFMMSIALPLLGLILSLVSFSRKSNEVKRLKILAGQVATYYRAKTIFILLNRSCFFLKISSCNWCLLFKLLSWVIRNLFFLLLALSEQIQRYPYNQRWNRPNLQDKAFALLLSAIHL